MLAFIDDDSTMEDHRHDECRGPSPSMSLRPPYLQNGWAASHSSRMQQQQLQQQQNSKTCKLDASVASPNVNNNNNNNDNSNANSGKT